MEHSFPELGSGSAPPLTPQQYHQHPGSSSSPSQPTTIQSRNAYVAGLPPTFDDAQLLKLVNTYCCERQFIESIKCVMDPRTRLCRGYGFVLFSDQGHAQRAVQVLDGLILPTVPGGVPTRARSSPSRGAPSGAPLQARLAHASAQPTRHDITSRNAANISEDAALAPPAAVEVPGLPPPPSYMATVTGTESVSAVFSSQGSSSAAFPMTSPQPYLIPSTTPKTIVVTAAEAVAPAGAALVANASDIASASKPFLVDSMFTSTMENPLFTNAAAVEHMLTSGGSHSQPTTVVSAQSAAAGTTSGLGMSFSSLMPASQSNMISVDQRHAPAQGTAMSTSPSASMQNLFEQMHLSGGQAGGANELSTGSLSGASSPAGHPVPVSSVPTPPASVPGLTSPVSSTGVHHVVVPSTTAPRAPSSPHVSSNSNPSQAVSYHSQHLLHHTQSDGSAASMMTSTGSFSAPSVSTQPRLQHATPHYYMPQLQSMSPMQHPHLVTAFPQTGTPTPPSVYFVQQPHSPPGFMTFQPNPHPSAMQLHSQQSTSPNGYSPMMTKDMVQPTGVPHHYVTFNPSASQPQLQQPQYAVATAPQAVYRGGPPLPPQLVGHQPHFITSAGPQQQQYVTFSPQQQPNGGYAYYPSPGPVI